MLAVLLGIAKGFGFQGTVRQELFDYFPRARDGAEQVFEFVESYLAQAQGGVIIGVGLILLFYTVINLISSVEDTFKRHLADPEIPVRGTGRYPIIWPYSSCCRC